MYRDADNPFGVWAEGYREKKWCKQCSRILPVNYHEEICPSCKEINLFAEVKEYIRNNDVKESDVAERFNIPVDKVKQWIREGRIEYRDFPRDEHSHSSITSLFCQVCGKAITFGSICTDCLRKQKKKGVATFHPVEDSKMRFLDGDIKK